MDKLLEGLLGGKFQGDVTVNVTFDPASSIFLALVLLIAFVGGHFIVKVLA